MSIVAKRSPISALIAELLFQFTSEPYKV